LFLPGKIQQPTEIKKPQTTEIQELRLYKTAVRRQIKVVGIQKTAVC
jgi:hypothetical protein